MMATTPYSELFFDKQQRDSLTSARIVLGELWSFLQPASVIDIGCGVGPWLKAAKENGADLIIGIDGDYVRRDRLLVDPSAFRSCNLEADNCRAVLAQGVCFDLVMSLEVAEHLSQARASSFVDELCGLGNLVLFSAAIPGQGGMNHINEQWPAYWNALFCKNGFACFDVVRPKVWENRAIKWWYAQNILLFARTGTTAYEALSSFGSPVSDPMPLVHPRLLAGVLSSASWKITAPLRAITSAVRGGAKPEDPPFRV
jgi:hypothetical protein